MLKTVLISACTMFLSTSYGFFGDSKKPKFAEDHFIGETKDAFEKTRGPLAPFSSQWCKKGEGCASFRKDVNVPGGSFQKEIWVRDGKISLLNGSLNVYPSKLLDQATVGEVLAKDEKEPAFIQAVPDDGGQTVAAIWEFDGGLAKIVGHCPGGVRGGKLVAKSFRKCILTAMWAKICRKDDPCKFADSYRKHDAPF